jgi:hypothetical protein
MTQLKERPDFYLTPSRDFTRYVRDCEQKYWKQETSFDWSQDVRKNLVEHLESLDHNEFFRISNLVLPLIQELIHNKKNQIRKKVFTYSEDALKDLAFCLDSRNESINRILDLYAPLGLKQKFTQSLKDKLDILRGELLDLKEQARLGIIKVGIEARCIQTDVERNELNAEIQQASANIAQLQKEFESNKKEYELELKTLKNSVQQEQNSLELELLAELEKVDSLIQHVLDTGELSLNSSDLALLKELIVKRQLRSLKDIANHALIVEQSAIAPLSMGIIHYKRYREIQEALTTFVNDEAKHTATFRRFLVEKLEAKEFISAQLINGAKRYMWIARFAPGLGMFLAVIVEAIGASYLAFFSKPQFMPDKLFRSISETISVKDETRHMDLCVDIYNELFRTGSKWERKRNHRALKLMMKTAYGDKHDDHALIQAFRSFGVEADVLYNHILGQLSHQLTRVGIFASPEKLLEYIGRTK